MENMVVDMVYMVVIMLGEYGGGYGEYGGGYGGYGGEYAW